MEVFLQVVFIYLVGAAIAYLMIKFINAAELYHDGEKLLSYQRSFTSWIFVLYCLVIMCITIWQNIGKK